MGLSFHCPQCSQPVPALVTQMGQQVTCPACKSQFRLSPMLLGGNGQSGAAASPPRSTTATPSPPAASPPAAAPVATAAAPPVATVIRPPMAPRASAPPTAAPVRSPVAAPAPSPPVAPAPKVPAASMPAAAAAPPQPKPNVARFIAAASQDSTVQLTAEGKLPELSLAHAAAKNPKATESNTSPLVLGLVVVGSTLLSIMLLVVNFEGGGAPSESVEEAREKIGQFYAGEAGPEKPYQALLREANLAHSRRDYQAERVLYGRVRDLLLSEQSDRFTGAGVTGTKSGDDELKRLLGILLSKEGR